MEAVGIRTFVFSKPRHATCWPSLALAIGHVELTGDFRLEGSQICAHHQYIEAMPACATEDDILMGSAVDAAALEPTANEESLPDPPPPPPFPGDLIPGEARGGALTTFEVLEHMTEAEKQAAGKVRWLVP